MKNLRSVILFLLPLLSFAQSPKPRYDLPPRNPPISCGLSLANTEMIKGSLPYVRLRFELAALSSAQEGTAGLKDGIDALNTEAAPTVAISSVFTGIDQSYDALRCSASIIGKYHPVDSDDETIRTLLIVAFNQEAAATTDLRAHIKEQLLRQAKDNTPAIQVKDAERITAMNALQREAAETILQAVSLSLMESVDLSDPSAKDTVQTVLTCDEFDDLKSRSLPPLPDHKTAYTDAVSLFVSFLEGHKCKK